MENAEQVIGIVENVLHVSGLKTRSRMLRCVHYEARVESRIEERGIRRNVLSGKYEG